MVQTYVACLALVCWLRRVCFLLWCRQTRNSDFQDVIVSGYIHSMLVLSVKQIGITVSVRFCISRVLILSVIYHILHVIHFQWEPSCTMRKPYIKKLITPFRNFATAPKNTMWSPNLWPLCVFYILNRACCNFKTVNDSDCQAVSPTLQDSNANKLCQTQKDLKCKVLKLWRLEQGYKSEQT